MTESTFVRHPSRPAWGPGLVVAEDRKTLTVAFEDYRQVRLSRAHVKVENIPNAEISKNCRIRFLPEKKRPASAGQPSIFPELMVTFLERWPQGFQDEAYIEQMRAYGEKAIEAAQQFLDKKQLQEMVIAGDYNGIYEIAKTFAGQTNLVHKFEQIRLNKLPETLIERFAIAFVNLLFGKGAYAPRFATFTDILTEGEAGKWPISTYFSFLLNPKEHVFVKPNNTKKCAYSLAFEIRYETGPNDRTYTRVQHLFAYTAERLTAVGHPPRDNLDVQQFLLATANH